MTFDPPAHLRIALQRLDLLIHREIVRLRARYALSLDEFRGLYVSDVQVDRLTNEILLEEDLRLNIVELTRRANHIGAVFQERSAVTETWTRLVQEFALSFVEQNILILALASEADAKYETLFAYLNNNVARKSPTVDLAVRLFGDDDTEALAVRRAFLPESVLLSEGLIEPIEQQGETHSRLSVAFRLSAPVSRFLLGLTSETIRSTDPPVEAVPESASEELWLQLRAAAEFFVQPEGPSPILVFEGRETRGLVDAAGAFCKLLNRDVKCVRSEALLGDTDDSAERLTYLRLEHRLHRHGICVEGIDSMLASDGSLSPGADRVVEHLRDLRGPVILTCKQEMDWKLLLQECRVLRFSFPEPSYDERLTRWRGLLANHLISDDAVEGLAARFQLSALQINRIYRRAVDRQRVERLPNLREDVLFESARFESSQQLGKLAVKVKPKHTWEDLVLPAVTMTEVREVGAAVRHRHLVYKSWGMERRVTYGRGLKVLFTGSSGTGKTMTASVIAHELALDLFKIDLSGIVSRYVGQTEKNLDKIFRAASTSNAILFFDEADALFGKRSEVKDAHDRYANIEISYLLLKMDEFDGVVILATNLKKNIDLAFSRRMHYVVEFPTPDEVQRERLWRGMFPLELPLDGSVDFPFLARNFELSGGDIQNVVLDASFQAAHDGRVVTMKQIVNAVARQLRKQGRLPAASDFRQYFPLVGTANGSPVNGSYP